MDQPVEAGAVGIHERLIADQCEAGTDVLSVWFRAALLQHLVQTGVPVQWLEGNEQSEAMFKAVASYPLEQGIQGLDLAAFRERLSAVF